MRVDVRRVAAQRLAQPIERPLVVPVGRVGVTEIEHVVRIGIGVGGLGEVVGRRPGLRRCAAAQHQHAKIVEHRGGRRGIRRALEQGLQSTERLVEPLQLDEGNGGAELRAKGDG